MTLFAWHSYKKYAWGKNELRPVSKTSHNPGIFGSAQDLGLTIVDSLDTLWIMGAEKEFQEGVAWIRDNFNINIV
jgi:mannosyl-oligosaccharide alpha-1,2-mannosidase